MERSILAQAGAGGAATSTGPTVGRLGDNGRPVDIIALELAEDNERQTFMMSKDEQREVAEAASAAKAAAAGAAYSWRGEKLIDCPACPNRTNPHHECAMFCVEQFGGTVGDEGDEGKGGEGDEGKVAAAETEEVKAVEVTDRTSGDGESKQASSCSTGASGAASLAAAGGPNCLNKKPKRGRLSF